MTMQHFTPATWGFLETTIDLYPHPVTASEWLYRCGPVPGRITKQPHQLVMTSNPLGDDPFEYDQTHADWGAYILGLLPQQLRERDLSAADGAEIRRRINAERLAAWLWARRGAGDELCWPRVGAMRFVRGLRHAGDGVANLFASAQSLHDAHAGWNAVPWTVARLALDDGPLCLDRALPFAADVAKVVAKASVRDAWRTPEARAEHLRLWLLKHHDPLVKAIAAATRASYRCSPGHQCRAHLLYGSAYLPASLNDLLRKLRKAIGARLPICFIRGDVDMDDDHVYIDIGLD